MLTTTNKVIDASKALNNKSLAKFVMAIAQEYHTQLTEFDAVLLLEAADRLAK